MESKRERVLSDGLKQIISDVDLTEVDNTDAHADLIAAVRARTGAVNERVMSRKRAVELADPAGQGSTRRW